MAGLLKDRARKPIIPTSIGIGYPKLKQVDGVIYFVLEIREPWAKEGYQSFQVLLTEKEMLIAIAEWTQTLARLRQ